MKTRGKRSSNNETQIIIVQKETHITPDIKNTSYSFFFAKLLLTTETQMLNYKLIFPHVEP